MKNKYTREGTFEAKIYDSASWKRICRISPIGLQFTTITNQNVSWVNGNFFFKEAYWAIRERDVSTQINTLTWNKFQIPKIKLFTWNALNQYLPFPNILNRLSYNMPSKCPFCLPVIYQGVSGKTLQITMVPTRTNAMDLREYMLEWWVSHSM
ncbi:unnamed protein product [Cuscuta campestris]|uniref:Reverse transcriptase zinc-binding domain-containing protein n=1 Tax=Cuscuta campestris TaxID=132261 RepID=A0A484MRU4_9ASTE|nr:unnamed protein product [Cuscuta campestris]